MNVHIVASVCQGVLDTVQVFRNKEIAEQAEKKAKEEFGIVEGAEAESENVVEVFYDVPIVERGKQ